MSTHRLPRRSFLRNSVLVAATGAMPSFGVLRADEGASPKARGILIQPGQWRPYFPLEHVAWIKTPWSDPLFPDFVFLDFPEAIFCNLGLLYLGHHSPRFPSLFPGLPKVAWKTDRGVLHYERVLPNGIEFGGSLAPCDASAVSLALYIKNGTNKPLTDIKLQVCALLKHTTSFSGNTADNKFVHTSSNGWQSFTEACNAKDRGRFRLGWREGPAVADLPVMVTVSDRRDQLIAITWYDDTYSLVCNPAHPCMHADPYFADIQPGQRRTIHGELLFFEGTLERFTPWFRKRSLSHEQGRP